MGIFFEEKKNLKKIAKHVRWTCLAIKITFFFWVGEKKCPCMFIVHVWNIFSGFFFFKAKKKTTHVSRHTWNFFIKFVKLVNHHTSPRTYLVFFQLTKSKVTYNFGQDDILRIWPQNKVALPETKSWVWRRLYPRQFKFLVFYTAKVPTHVRWTCLENIKTRKKVGKKPSMS